MQKSRKLVVGLFLLISVSTSFISCEGGTTFIKIVANHSSDTIKLKLYQSIFINSDAFTILPKEYKTVFVWDIERGFADETYQCTSEIDSFAISISGEHSLRKDFMDSGNWVWQRKDGRNASETCTFTVTDADYD